MSRPKPSSPVAGSRVTAVQRQTNQPVKQSPSAPAAYRPNPTPKVLQPKMSPAATKDNEIKRVPTAPPAYRPQPEPKVLQRKLAVGQPATGKPSSSSPTAPAVYRPNLAQRVLQRQQVARPAAFGSVIQRALDEDVVAVDEPDVSVTTHHRCTTDSQLFSFTQSSLSFEQIERCPVHNSYFEDVDDEAGHLYYCRNASCKEYRISTLTTDACLECNKAKVRLSEHPCFPVVVGEEPGLSKKTRQRLAKKRQLGKDDNSGHGKHVDRIPKGSKGDRHAKGQKRKADRVKTLTKQIQDI